nr:hypothetical protein [Tanacetum cinerariifolium]
MAYRSILDTAYISLLDTAYRSLFFMVSCEVQAQICRIFPDGYDAQMFGYLARVQVDSDNDAMVCVMARRLAEHFWLLTEDRVWGLTMVILDLTGINRDELAPQPPPPAAVRTMPQRMTRLAEEVHELRERLVSSANTLIDVSIDYGLKNGNQHESVSIRKGNDVLGYKDLIDDVKDYYCYWSSWKRLSGNMSYLIDYEEIDRGYVAFGGNPKGGKITSKESAFKIFELVFIELIESMAIVRNLMIGNGGVEAKGPWLKAKSKILKLESKPRWKKVASVRWIAEHTSVASNNIMTQGLSNAPKEHARCADAVNNSFSQAAMNSTIGNGGVEVKGPWLKAKSKNLKLASKPRWKKVASMSYLAMVVYHVGDMAVSIMQQHMKLIINERCLGMWHDDEDVHEFTTHIGAWVKNLVKYKPGVTNEVDNAILRAFEDEEAIRSAFMGLSQPMTELLNDLKQDNEFDNTPIASHSGVKRMLVGLSALFYWKGMRKSVKEFIGRDMVLIKLQPYCQVTVAERHSNKLAKRYYGSFKVLERVGKVACRLAIPDFSKIHPAIYGRVPPTIIPYPLASSKVATVEETLIERDAFLRKLGFDPIEWALQDLGRLENLEELILSYSRFDRLPDSILMVKHLKSLKLTAWGPS